MDLETSRATWQSLLDEKLGSGTGLRVGVGSKGLRLFLRGQPLEYLDKLLVLQSKSSKNLWQRPVIPTIFPTAPRGEPRERFFTLAVRECVESKPGPEKAASQQREADLADQLKSEVGKPIEIAKRSAIRAVYQVYQPRSRGKAFFHPVPGKGIPLYFGDDRYKMFTGQILYTMLQRQVGDSSELDEELTGEVLNLLLNPTGFLLDQTLGAVVKKTEGALKKGDPSPAAFMQRAEKRHLKALKEFDKAGPFAPPHWDLQGLRRYQEDLRTIFAARLPRLETVRAVMFTTYLHLWLRFYRTAFALHQQAWAFFAAQAAGSFAELPALLRSDDEALSRFAGQMRFRWNDGHRSVSRGEDAAASFRSLHDEALGHLPYHLLAIRLASRIIRSLKGPPVTSYASLASYLRESGRAEDFDHICRAILLFYHQFLTIGTTPISCRPGTGLQELRELIQRHTDLARHYKTVADSLVLPRTADGMTTTQGNVRFFQVGSQPLFWLAKFITGNDSVPLREFFDQLASRYGLAPQDRHERGLLVKSLSEMNLFTRYADAGESHYVSHIL